MSKSTNKSPGLELTGMFEGKTFTVCLSDCTTATVADLAREVHYRTGLSPLRQRIEYKGIVFDPPDTDKWAPLLDDLNFKSGDAFSVSRSARPLSDAEVTSESKTTELTLAVKDADTALASDVKEGMDTPEENKVRVIHEP